MVIYINGRFLSQNITGVQRYSIELLRALDKLILDDEALNKNFNFILLVPKNIIHKISFKRIKIRKIGILKGHLWEQIELPLYTKQKILFNPCGPAPIFKKNQLVTIHDAAVYENSENFSHLFLLWYKIMFKFLSKKAKKIITVSNFSKQELKKYLKTDNIYVDYLGYEHISRIRSDDSILLKHNLSKKKYIFAVSSMSPNKNFNNIVKAVELLQKSGSLEKTDVVIAGGTHPKVFNNSFESLPKNIKYVGYVSDNELKSLYENAGVFLYPSFYEGFGLPPIEAMALNCAVIVSNKASLPEVCSDAACYCNPKSPNDIADKILKVMNNTSYRVELENKGKNRARKFTWEKCAKNFLNQIKELDGNKLF